MKEQIVIAGYGGQGVILTGKVLGLAGMNKGLNVTVIPSYGAEMRGGTANCRLILSDEPIGSPLIEEATTLIALSLLSMRKFESLLAPGGLLIYNTSLIDEAPKRGDIRLCPVAANAIAEEKGLKRAVNMAAAGAFLKTTGILGFEDIEAGLKDVLSARNQKHIPANMTVVEAAYGAAKIQPPAQG